VLILVQDGGWIKRAKAHGWSYIASFQQINVKVSNVGDGCKYIIAILSLNFQKYQESSNPFLLFLYY
jgi:hypothetical protein